MPRKKKPIDMTRYEAVPIEQGGELELPWHTARHTLERWNRTFVGAAFILIEREHKRFIRHVPPGSRQPRLTGDALPRDTMAVGSSIPGAGRQTWPLVAKWNRRYAPSRYEARRDPETREVRIWRTK